MKRKFLYPTTLRYRRLKKIKRLVMESLAYNPITITLFAIGFVVVATTFVVVDALKTLLGEGYDRE